VVKANYCVLVCIVVCFLILLIYLRIQYTCTVLVSLTEMTQRKSPCVRFHSTSLTNSLPFNGFSNCGMEILNSIILKIIAECRLMNHQSRIGRCFYEFRARPCISRVTDLNSTFMLDHYSKGLRAMDHMHWVEVLNLFTQQVFLE
jgi:hypothetical protein